MVYCNKLDDEDSLHYPFFALIFVGKITYIPNINFVFVTNKTKIVSNLMLIFPFEVCDFNLISNTSAIITTMCKNYTHRLDEWIQYNLNLGFSGIVIFNNDGNMQTSLSESLDFCVMGNSIETLCNKYKNKVWVVDFPYCPIDKDHWNKLQCITLTIGVQAFRNKCRNIALIDADEFIYISKNPFTKIETFLQEYDTSITMQSNILTNKNNNDILNNNILHLAKYIGENKHTKTILHTDTIHDMEYILTPHNHPSHIILDKNTIIHYHCWMNIRYPYKESMQYTDIFRPFLIYYTNPIQAQKNKRKKLLFF